MQEIDYDFTGVLYDGTPITVWGAKSEYDAKCVILRKTGQIICLAQLKLGEQTPEGFILDLR